MQNVVIFRERSRDIIMNKRIYFGKNTPLSFRESLPFSRDCPYTIRCKDVTNDDVAPPHYAGTMEIDVCCEITGEAVIDHQHISFSGSTVLVIPPGVVHSIALRTGPGRVYVLHISFESLRPCLDVDALLELSGKSLTGLDRVCPCFDRIHDLVLEMIHRDNEPICRTRALLEILELLFQQSHPELLPVSHGGGEALRRILRWTETYFTDEITTEQAARTAGFSKNYFCAWFKGNTGLTYNNYLNQVRINHACQILAQTDSVSIACYSSGFRDMSYFVQRFKKNLGVTPKRYLQNLNSFGTDSENKRKINKG